MSLAEVGEADAALQAALAAEDHDITASLAAVTAQMQAASDQPAPAEEEAAEEAAPAPAEAEAAAAPAGAEAAEDATPAADVVPELSSMAPPAGATISCSETLFSYLGSGAESTLGTRLADLFSCTLSAAITAAEAHDPTPAQPQPAAAEEAPVAADTAGEEEEDKLRPEAPTAELVAALRGYRLLSGSADRTLRVWDVAESPAVTHVMEGHKNWVHAVCDAGDGRVVSGSDDCTVRLWRLEDCACELVLKGHTGYVTAVCLLPGHRLLSGSDDTTLRVWRLDDGSCELVLNGHAGDVTCACVVAGGELAVSGSRDKTLCVWRVAPDSLGRACAHVLRGHNNTVYAVAALPDSPSHVVSGGADTLICLWNAVAGTCDRVIEGLRAATIYSLCVLPAADGGVLVSGTQEGTVAVWSLEDGALLGGMFGHRDSVLALVPLPGGRVASGSQDGTLRVWHVGAGAQLQRQNHGSEAVLMAHTNWVMATCMLPPGPPRASAKARKKGGQDDTSSDDE